MTSLSKRHKQNDDGEDDLERCPRCNIHFATTLDSTGTWWPLPVPISCLVCGGSTLCRLCVDKVDQCSVCGSTTATCFDKNVPNAAFCRALDRIRDLKAGDSSRSSLSVGDLDEDQQKPEANINENHPDITAATTATGEDLLHAGDRVFCIWDSDGLYYRGRIAAVHCITETGVSSSHDKRILSTTYKIDFDDGDTRWAAPRNDILTMEEAASKDLVVAGTGIRQENQQTARKHTAIESPLILVGKGGQLYHRANKKKKHA